MSNVCLLNYLKYSNDFYIKLGLEYKLKLISKMLIKMNQ